MVDLRELAALMTYACHLSLLIVQGQGQAMHLNQPPQRARRCAHFNYRQSNLSTPPHPGSLSTRYALSSFKQNLLRTSKAWQRVSVPELTIKLHNRARFILHVLLLKVLRTHVLSATHPQQETSATLYVKCWSLLQLLYHFTTVNFWHFHIVAIMFCSDT